MRFLVCLLFSFLTGVAFAQETADGAKPDRAGPMRPDGGPGAMKLQPPQPFPQAAQIPPPKNEIELAAAISKLGDQLAAEEKFSGAVLLAVDGKRLVEKAGGLADRTAKLPNTTETSFDIASIGKLFTQIAIFQLHQAGKISLDEPFAKYLKDYPNAEVAGKVTVRQLLMHSSGIGDIAAPGVRETKAGALRSLKDFVPLFAREPLAFEPGSQKRYSNAGYVVLGRVIEEISGEDYYQYIENHILAPAGMNHSGFYSRTELGPNVARSYDGDTDVTRKHWVRGTPAGGLQATVGDLLRFIEAIDTAKLIEKDFIPVVRDMIPRPPSAPQPSDPNRLMAYGVSGGAEGVNAQLNIDAIGRYVRIVLCNNSPPMASQMSTTIGEWLKQLPSAAAGKP